MIMSSDEELKDWEIREEEPPEALKKKWDREEAAGPKRLVCSSCKKEVSSEHLTCIFCGALLKPVSSQGFLFWLKRFLKRRF